MLDALSEASRAPLCFATRKRNEAWNPGSFGYRGLLVYGRSGFERRRVIPVSPQRSIGFIDCLQQVGKARRLFNGPQPVEGGPKQLNITSRQQPDRDNPVILHNNSIASPLANAPKSLLCLAFRERNA